MCAETSRQDVPDLTGASAVEIVQWAVDRFAPDIAVACSMQDAVVVDLSSRVLPGIEVFFLNTGFHFPQTLATAQRLRRNYPVTLIELGPRPKAATYSSQGYDACCRDRKVLPLEEYLSSKKAWISGIRRADSPGRASAEPVEWDDRRGLMKINPIVDWTDDDVRRYIDANDVAVNPLRDEGYESIGCWPCTAPGAGREGRWPQSSKTECGIHSREPSLSDRPYTETLA